MTWTLLSLLLLVEVTLLGSYETGFFGPRGLQLFFCLGWGSRSGTSVTTMISTKYGRESNGDKDKPRTSLTNKRNVIGDTDH